MTNLNKEFSPCYIWPTEVIPFRIYFESDKMRIFIIENLQHNFEWLKKYGGGIRKTDIFFVIIGCYYHDWLVKEAEKAFSELQLDLSQFFILFNDEREKRLFEDAGFTGEIVNQNAWLDERHVMRPLPLAKIYDAIYVGRLIEVKRHWLANNVGNLAIVAGPTHGASSSHQIPPHTFRNEIELSPEQVCMKINEAYCGLILSASEGASFASSEYLLCGIPVVSTPSEGGRDAWYDEFNSIIVEPDPYLVAAAVRKLIESPRDPQTIRSTHVNKQYYYRCKFLLLLESIFTKYSININAVDFFWRNFFHKMRGYIKPDFERIFS